MREKILDRISVALYICGFLIFVWPDVNSMQNSWKSQKAVQEFEKQAEKAGETLRPQEDAGGEEKSMDVKKQKDGTASGKKQDDISLNGLYTAMQEYNRKIYENGQSDMRDPWSYQQNPLDLSEYGIEEQAIGVIEVPVMNIELPIYPGARKENLAKGAALLGQTSFPIAGENNNSVIAGHRGWKGIPMFREIDRLKIGDVVTIRNFWETLTYQVIEIRIVMPEDIEEILIRPGKSMVTLITCHPYTQNSRRYVVFCEKIDTVSAETEEDEAEKGNAGTDDANQDPGIGESDSGQNLEGYGEDQGILQREKRIHIVGYIVFILIGFLILGRGCLVQKKKC